MIRRHHEFLDLHSPVGDSSGTCWGIDLDMFNTIACIPPQCEDYVFNFEMRTYHCSCTKPPATSPVTHMPSDSWIITIEGQTVVETPVISNTIRISSFVPAIV